MTATVLQCGLHGVQVPVDQIDGTEQASTYAETAISGASINAVPFSQISFIYVASAASGSVTVKTYGANDSDFTQERLVNAVALSATEVGSWSATAPLYGWYRPKILDTVSGTTGSIAVYALAR